MSLLHTTDLTIGHARKPLLRSVGMDLQAGELVVLLGVNGIGKSTLLRTLAGLLPPLHGSIALQGKQLSTLSAMERARLVSVVLPGRPEVGLMDVWTLVALGRQPWTGHFGRLGPTDHAAIEHAMDVMEVAAFAQRDLRTLSDGELQRVLIARALAQRTSVLLLDEPTAFLDVVNRLRIMQRLHRVTRELHALVVLSTHDLQSALDHADRVLLATPGRLWSGTPQLAIEEGRLQDAFKVDGLRFDPLSASFRP
jgi:iron complex transport system ATP-binding protein